MAYTTIDDPSEYFHTKLYSGTGSELSVTNDANAGDFKPDWIWIKQRNAGSTDHGVFDSSRGVTKNLKANTSDAESTEAQSVKTFNTDGFTLGTSGDYNGSSDTHVAWQWKCNGGTTSATVAEDEYAQYGPGNVRQTNTDAGFSIIKYTGTGQAGQIQHGLGAIPHWVVIKQRTSVGGVAEWVMFHKSLGPTHYVKMSTTAAKIDSSGLWNDEAPTSNVFTVNSSHQANADSGTFIGYFFTEKQGYSKFGSYTGNGDEGGPFVHTGFKPQWIMFKNTGAAEEWVLQDTTRNPNNPVTKNIRVDSSIAEANATNIDFDFLSNGFKNRSDQAQLNSSGVSYIYMAFAEHPFVSSKGVPTTAR